MKSGAQKKDISSVQRFVRDFPMFQLTNSRGMLNPKSPPYFIIIPKS